MQYFEHPVTLIHGTRQYGKTTLALQLGEALGYYYVSFDDYLQRQSAIVDPIGFVLT